MNSTTPKTYLLFLGIVIANIVLTFSLNYLLVDDNLIFNEYSSQLSYERIKEILELNEKYKYISFLLIPLIYIVKFSVIAIILAIGFFFLKDRLELEKIFKVVIVCELIFLTPIVIKIIWFLFIDTNYTLGDLKAFSPISLINFFDLNKLEKWMRYPISLINIFELIYCFTLTLNLKNTLNISMKNASLVVLFSYGTGLLLWVVFITFLSLNAT
jgi:hypothetical protein